MDNWQIQQTLLCPVYEYYYTWDQTLLQTELG